MQAWTRACVSTGGAALGPKLGGLKGEAQWGDRAGIPSLQKPSPRLRGRKPLAMGQAASGTRRRAEKPELHPLSPIVLGSRWTLGHLRSGFLSLQFLVLLFLLPGAPL